MDIHTAKQRESKTVNTIVMQHNSFSTYCIVKLRDLIISKKVLSWLQSKEVGNTYIGEMFSSFVILLFSL